MKKMTIDNDCESDGVKAVAEFRDALRTIAGKWKGEILWHLAKRTHRFGELRRAIPGITQHMLTAQLRELEADGLVKRTAYSEIPPRVEYEVTAAAHALRPVFEALFEWSRQYGKVARKVEQMTRPQAAARGRTS
jgi:DNA-binding HxlR family transcriptional regulator